MKLTPKQQRFVDHYLVDLNATKAALAAGYSEKTAKSAASRLLTNVNVRAEIDQRNATLATQLEVTRDRVINEIARIAFGDITDVIKWGRIKVAVSEATEIPEAVYDIDLVPSDELSEDATRAIAEIRRTRDGVTVKMHNKLAALEALTKHLGLNQPEEEEPPRKIEISWLEPREPTPEQQRQWAEMTGGGDGS